MKTELKTKYKKFVTEALKAVPMSMIDADYIRFELDFSGFQDSLNADENEDMLEAVDSGEIATIDKEILDNL